MSRLVRVELGRFFGRRAIAWLLLAGVLVTAALAFRTVWDTRPPTHNEVATAQARSAEAADEPSVQQELRECRAHPTSYLGAHGHARSCRALLLPSAHSMLPRQELSVSGALRSDAVRLAVLIAGLLVIAAATFAGAEWSWDTISTQLTFESRRTRVWVAKATAVVLGAALAGAALLVAYLAVLGLTAQARDLAVTGATWQHAGWFLLRAVALCAAAALGGFALTMLFRSTVATLALLFVYAAGGELLVLAFPLHGAGRWAVGNNLYAWLHQHFSYFDRGAGCRPFTDCDPMRSLGQLDAAWFLGALLVVAVLASLVSFRHRDL